ncbi:MAG: helix-turn-helix domain-containing protein [Actinomycetota bacterium]
MKVRFSYVEEFVRELEKDRSLVDRGIVRITFRYTPLAPSRAGRGRRVRGMATPVEDPLLTVRDVAGLCNVSPSAVYEWARTRQIPCLRIAGVLRFRSAEVEGWIAAAHQPAVPRAKAAERQALRRAFPAETTLDTPGPAIPDLGGAENVELVATARAGDDLYALERHLGQLGWEGDHDDKTKRAMDEERSLFEAQLEPLFEIRAGVLEP